MEILTDQMNATRERSSKNRGGAVLTCNEADVWQPVQTGWRQLYGGFYEIGVSIEWHDFRAIDDFIWSRSFHPGSLELCLNVAGSGRVCYRKNVQNFQPLTAGFYVPGKTALHATRAAGQQHQFVTIEFSLDFVRRHLSACDGALHSLVELFLQRNSHRAGIGEISRLNTKHEQLITHLLHPPVFQGARALWYQSKILELMADFFFARNNDELFCDRQKRIARERVDRVIAILRQDLAAPPELEELGRQAGCSHFHLSRTFSREMQMTIPQYLRKLRMERAAELLQSGKYNVTEAALEVGYSSLSHFSQAFCQTMGRCPGLYPLKVSTNE